MSGMGEHHKKMRLAERFAIEGLLGEGVVEEALAKMPQRKWATMLKGAWGISGPPLFIEDACMKAGMKRPNGFEYKRACGALLLCAAKLQEGWRLP